jgi:hypothetical protein
MAFMRWLAEGETAMDDRNIDNHGSGLGERQLAEAAAENEDAMAGAGDPSGKDDVQFSNEHPLSSPGELAGTADAAIAREMAALGPADGSLADAAGVGDGDDPDNTMGDAIGAGAGMDIGAGSPEPQGELGGGDPGRTNSLPLTGQ